jgi:hypothetical protein
VDFDADVGCRDYQDLSERSHGFVCDDGIDNDGDGAIDYPFDSGCFNVISDAERACSNGDDDDGDGAADFPVDAGCADADDESEKSPSIACDDGLDNDGDGYKDYIADADQNGISDAPGDPACQTPAFARETRSARTVSATTTASAPTTTRACRSSAPATAIRTASIRIARPSRGATGRPPARAAASARS